MSFIDIYYWCDGTWCFVEELGEYLATGHSDDFCKVSLEISDDLDIDAAVQARL
jgi:hypothetical protein